MTIISRIFSLDNHPALAVLKRLASNYSGINPIFLALFAPARHIPYSPNEDVLSA